MEPQQSISEGPIIQNEQQTHRPTFNFLETTFSFAQPHLGSSWSSWLCLGYSTILTMWTFVVIVIAGVLGLAVGVGVFLSFGGATIIVLD